MHRFPGMRALKASVDVFLNALHYYLMFLLIEHAVITLVSSITKNIFEIRSSVEMLICTELKHIEPTSEFPATISVGFISYVICRNKNRLHYCTTQLRKQIYGTIKNLCFSLYANRRTTHQIHMFCQHLDCP
jgi:hypothetical protein